MPRNLNIVSGAIAVTVVIMFIATCTSNDKNDVVKNDMSPATTTVPANLQWVIPDTSELTNTSEAQLIRYSRSLIVNTAYYFGPKGVIANKSNGLNCQSCHLNAGTKLFGYNFSVVSTGYPRFKARSGTVETIVKKVDDCFERSLNGKKIDSNSREMKAFIAYFEWIGKNVKKGTKPQGWGVEELPFLNRAADTVRGRMVYASKCEACHGKNGMGVLNAAGTAYTYPPLWGRYSYNIGASIYTISKFAGYVKNNMPFVSSYKNKRLTNQEAWDVAAFVNSQYHPFKNISADWPNLSTKPYDYPFGPYADHLFTKEQRKYGPFAQIEKHYKSLINRK